MSDDDEKWMRRCIDLAVKAAGRTAPNPLVGCVIVKDGEVVGEGFHARAGEPHAEIVALRRAKGRARGATLYVNLEPCNHHGRTPPCAPDVIEAGVARVVIGMLDPLREHTGGANRIKRAGIDVTRGVLEDDCRDLNRPWIRFVESGRPYCLLKAGITLDGKIATHKGDTRWITGERSRGEAHWLRNYLDAIVVGVNTILIDDPWLTARGVDGFRDPIRIILDTHARTPPDAHVMPRKKTKDARVIIATTEAAPAAKRKKLEERGADVWVLPTSRRRVDLHELLRRLGKEGVMGLLVEGGAQVHATFVLHDLVDEIRLFVAPMILGGGISETAGPTWIAGKGVAMLQNAKRFQFDEPPRMQGEDVVLTARRRPNP